MVAALLFSTPVHFSFLLVCWIKYLHPQESLSSMSTLLHSLIYLFSFSVGSVSDRSLKNVQYLALKCLECDNDIPQISCLPNQSICISCSTWWPIKNKIVLVLRVKGLFILKWDIWRYTQSCVNNVLAGQNISHYLSEVPIDTLSILCRSHVLHILPYDESTAAMAELAFSKVN